MAGMCAVEPLSIFDRSVLLWAVQQSKCGGDYERTLWRPNRTAASLWWWPQAITHHARFLLQRDYKEVPQLC
ncbi:hypothetical protein Plhal304r1_c081g0166751 [Plasmopara halstedii]